MAKVKQDQRLVTSVLDRLIDEQPDLSHEPEKDRHQVIAELRRSVRRDLENLLNTRRQPVSWPAELTELTHSLVSYGIPDISGEDLGAPSKRRKFLKQVEDIIRNFEPRFQSVRVIEAENADAIDRTLRFRIDAVLYAYPVPEPIVFDSALETSSKTFRISSGDR